MKSDLELLLIRHAATAWNREKRLQGRRDIPLSKTGRKSLSNKRPPAPFKHWPWYTSPLLRTRQTAELLGIDAKCSDALVEMDWGQWEGERLPELRSRLGPAMALAEAQGLDLQPPGGESPRKVRRRLLAWLNEQQGQMGLVTHKGVIRALLSEALDWNMKDDCPIKPDWQKGIHLRRRRGVWELVTHEVELGSGLDS